MYYVCVHNKDHVVIPHLKFRDGGPIFEISYFKGKDSKQARLQNFEQLQENQQNHIQID